MIGLYRANRHSLPKSKVMKCQKPIAGKGNGLLASFNSSRDGGI